MCSVFGTTTACIQSYSCACLKGVCSSLLLTFFSAVFVTVTVTVVQPLLESVKAGLPEAACAKLNKAQRVVEVGAITFITQHLSSLTLQSYKCCASLNHAYLHSSNSLRSRR
jgi:hypothetical protein